MKHRVATESDVPAIVALMDRSADLLQRAFLTPSQHAASRHVMGLDTQLIADRSYFVVEDAGALVGCGGWSRRATLFGDDASVVGREAALLDPASDAARIRAMYTDPAHVRRGIGRLLLSICEDAARHAGFATVELMATLAGEPLYRTCCYEGVERISVPIEGFEAVPMLRMRKSLTDAGDRTA